MYLYMICKNIKIKVRAILYIRKWGLFQKKIRCKALDASPMFPALFSNAIFNISSKSQSQPMGMKFLEWRLSQHSKKYETICF